MEKPKMMLCIFSVIMVIGIFHTWFYSAQAQESGTLKIGAVTSITGPMAPGFKGLYDAVKPTERLVNERGGVTVNGRKYLVKMVVEDDKSSVEGAVTAANKLIQDGIRFIVAPIFMVAFKAINPITEEAKVILVEPMTGDPTLCGPYNFIATMSGYYIPTIYQKLQSSYPQVKNIALVMADDPGVHSMGNLVEKEIKKRNLNIVIREFYKIGTQDFYPILTKALTKKPDAIECVASIVPWSASIINGARELGFSGPIYCATPFGDIHQLNRMVKPDYAYDLFHGAPDVLNDNLTPILKDLRELLKKDLKITMSMENIMCLSALYPLLQAIEKADSFDTDIVVKAWESMESIDTIFGKGVMAGKELVGINHIVRGPVPYSQIMNGVIEGELIVD